VGVGIPREIAAVVFDLDGVLVDSEPVWEEVRHGLVAERGGRWRADAQSQLMGMSTPEWARYLSEELGVGLPAAEVAKVVVDRMAARYTEQLPVLPGADEAVRRIHARWPLGLASSSPRRLIDTVLARTGWDVLFAVTVSTEEVARGKPSPEVYRTVADQLAAKPAACVAVEDSTNGLRAAVSAGMAVIAIPQPRYPPAADALASAVSVLPDLASLTVHAVESLAR
jgi:HAD superfamily hydrolase (TIGR01509 family)